MKKRLLTAGLLLGSVCAIAQVNFGFEAAEGYTAGNIHGQERWNVNYTGDIISAVTTLEAKTGAHSLHLQSVPSKELVHLHTDSPSMAGNGSLVDVSFDIYLATVNMFDGVTVTMDTPSEEDVASQIMFMMDNNQNPVILIAHDQGMFTPTEQPFTPGQWHHLEIKHDFDAGMIRYYIDGTMFYTGGLPGQDKIERIRLTVGANRTIDAYVDNISVSNAVLGIGEHKPAVAALYPNPATALINIDNGGYSIDTVTIADMNGRVMQHNNYSNITQVQLPLSGIAAGMYLVTVSSGGSATTHKMIVN